MDKVELTPAGARWMASGMRDAADLLWHHFDTRFIALCNQLDSDAQMLETLADEAEYVHTED